jgi:signal transduction histidine kinase
MLRSPDDVQEIQPPSWWTATHLFYLIAVLGILMFIFFALALYERMDRWRLQAVLNERERLAHEIHDTLAQSFAGIGFQMQAIRRAIPDELPQLREQVDLARALVRHSHKEARRSIQPIHFETPQNADLMGALQSSARRMVDGGLVEVAVTTTGHSHPLPEKVTDALLHIGQEAIANSVRHADPKHLTLILTYEKSSVQLVIGDDGCGFEESGALLGFGLRGMRRRAAAVSAKLDIVSSPGAGTQVTVICPLPSSHLVNSLFKKLSRFNLKDGSHILGEQEND